MARYRNPLEPAATWVYVFLALVFTMLALVIVSTVLGTGSGFGLGSYGVCAEMQNGTVHVPATDNNVVLNAEAGVRSMTATVRICADSPTIGQRLLTTLSQLPTFLVLIGALLLAARLIRAASREGIFTERMARRLRVLGWFVLAGELLATFLEAQGRQWLTNTMVTAPHNAISLNDWDIPVLALFLGAVLISMARIMLISSAMREELEGTV